jgi:antitoxin ParD1/3/4
MDQSFTLDDREAKYVESQVAAGRFASAKDVIEAALALLRERDDKLARLREAIREGEESGRAEPFDFDEFLAEMNAQPRANA